METEEVGIQEFRENLAGYLEVGHPLAITRDGKTLGLYFPRKRVTDEDIAAMKAAAKELDETIAEWGVSEDELMREIEEIKRASRENHRAE